MPDNADADLETTEDSTTPQLKIEDNALKLCITENDVENKINVVEFSQEHMKLLTDIIRSKADLKTITINGRDLTLHGNVIIQGTVKKGTNAADDELVTKNDLNQKSTEVCDAAVIKSHNIGLANKVLVTDELGKLKASDSISTTDLFTLKNINENIQTQINDINDKFTNNNCLDLCFVGDGSVNNNEFTCLTGVTSNIQLQLDDKQLQITTKNRINANCLGDGQINDNELNCLMGVETNIQTQLDDKQVQLTQTNRLHANCIGDGNVTDESFNCLSGVKSSIQLQINELSAEPTFTGIPKCAAPTEEDPDAVSEVASIAWCNQALETAKQEAISNFSSKKVMMSDEDGTITTSEVTDIELSYLKGVRDAIQQQIDAKQQKITTNNKLHIACVGNGDVNNDELSRLKGIKYNVQSQLNSKQNVIDSLHLLNPAFIGGGYLRHHHFDYLRNVNGCIQKQLNARELQFTHSHRLNPLYIGNGHVTHAHFDCLSGARSCIQDQLDCKELRFTHTHRLNPLYIGDGLVTHENFSCLAGVTGCIQDQLDNREIRFTHAHRLDPLYIGFGNVTHEHFSCLAGATGCIQDQLNNRELRFTQTHRLNPVYIGSGEVTYEHFHCLKGATCNIQEKLNYLSNKPVFKDTPLAPDKYTLNREEGALSELATKSYVRHKIRGITGYLTIPDGCGDTMVLEFCHGLLIQTFNCGANWSSKIPHDFD